MNKANFTPWDRKSGMEAMSNELVLTERSCHRKYGNEVKFLKLMIGNHIPNAFDHHDQVDCCHSREVQSARWLVVDLTELTMNLDATEPNAAAGQLKGLPYVMLPIVSSLLPPTGHLFTSSLRDLRWNQPRIPFAPISNMESIPAARMARDPEAIVAYTTRTRQGR